jgi:hypothetical protein
MIIQPDQAFLSLLASPTIARVGHPLEIEVTMPTGPTLVIPPPHISLRPAIVLKDGLILEIDGHLQGIEINTPIIGHSPPVPIDPAHSKPDLPLTSGNRMYLGQLDLGHVPLLGQTRAPIRGHHPLASPANSLDPPAGIGKNNNNVEMHVTCWVLPTIPPLVIDQDLLLRVGKTEIQIDLGSTINTFRVLVVVLQQAENATAPTVAREIVIL